MCTCACVRVCVHVCVCVHRPSTGMARGNRVMIMTGWRWNTVSIGLERPAKKRGARERGERDAEMHLYREHSISGT